MKYTSLINEVYFIDLPVKMEPIVSSETSAIRTQTPGNYPKRNKLHLEHGESLKTRKMVECFPAHRTHYVMDSAGPMRTGVVYCDDACHKHARMQSLDGGARS